MDLDFVSVHKNAKRELGQYPAILNSRLVNNIYISNKRKWNNCFIKNAPKMSFRLFYVVRRTRLLQCTDTV